MGQSHLKKSRSRFRHKAPMALGVLAMMFSIPNAVLAHEGSSATAEIIPLSGSAVSGTLKLTQPGVKVRIRGELQGLSPGKHGFHIHTNGNCDSVDGSSAGGHYSPAGGRHGAPTAQDHHLGDLGNIQADATGKAVVNTEISGVTLALIGTNSIIDRAIIIHAAEDDFSDPVGNSGARIGCAVIEQDMMTM